MPRTKSKERPNLTLVQAAALEKLGKDAKELLSKDESIPPGAHTFDFDCNLSGILTKLPDTSQYAPFKVEPSLRTLIYAALSAAEDPARALKKVIESVPTLKISPKDLSSFDSILDRYLEDCKAAFQKKAGKSPKSGSTSITGSVELLTRQEAAQ